MSTTNPHAAARPALEEHAADPLVMDVLLATDGGEAGVGAMKWLAHRAKMHRLNIRVLTVIETDPVMAALDQRMLLNPAEHALTSAEAYLARTAPSAEVATGVLWGDARQEFAEVSRDADILVVGTNRTGRLAGLLGSSFSTKVAESARCPVVVVPKTWHAGHGPVVVGVQGDGSDDAALQFAAHEATILHRELRIVHAWQFPSIGAPVAVADDDTTAVVDAHDSLVSDTVARLREENPGLAVRGAIVEGRPATALNRGAEGAELLVVGTHGWTVMDRFFIGSTSREILAHPMCPVAVVRPYRKGSVR